MKNETEETDQPHGNMFLNMLQTLKGGETLDEAAKEMAKAVQFSRAHGKAVKLKIEIVFKPASKGNGRAIEIIPDVVAVMPRLTPDSDLMFANDDGSVQREDPKQMLLKAKGIAIIDGGKKDVAPVEIAAN